jgi:TonB family protein
MIASWMSYAFLVGALLAIAAIVVERINTARRWPMRAVWAVTLFLSIAWPVGSAVREVIAARMKPVTVLPFTITVQPSRIVSDQPLAPDRAALIDRLLVALWIGLSLVLLLRLVSGVLTVRRSRRKWARGEIDGTPVRLSDNVGPAVVGLHPMDVVVPEWILTLDAPLRAIVLRHEEEHRSARDPYLLFCAAIGVVLMPWNIPLWIQARRLRLAIEMDCDARVLRAHPSPERYGLLMLTIAQRRSVAPTLFAPMLSEPTTQLERRILAMRTTTRRLGRLTLYGGIALTIGVLAFACSLTSDVPSTPDGAQVSTSLRPVGAAPDPSATSAQALPNNPAPEYPAALRAAHVEGTVVAQFVVDATGAPEPSTFKVLESSQALFTDAVRSNLASMKFTPARVSGKPVKQLVQTAFAFNLAKVASSTTARPQGQPTPVNDNQTYFEFQVEKQVSPDPRNVPPRYPDMLRSANVEGEVLMQFVVRTDGTPDTSTFKVLKSTHDLFTQAVRAALPRMRFFPAQVGGKAVKQLVQMPFQFNLAH